MSNKTNYLKAVRENVTVEFQEYREAELKKSKEEIFNDNNKIRFYTELADFFECSPEAYLDEEHFRCLYQDGKSVICCLYDYYLSNEYASINNRSDLTDMIRNYNEKYFSDILKSEAEAE